MMFEYTLTIFNGDKHDDLLHVTKHVVISGALHVWFNPSTRIREPYVFPNHAYTLAMPGETEYVRNQ